MEGDLGFQSNDDVCFYLFLRDSMQDRHLLTSVQQGTLPGRSAQGGNVRDEPRPMTDIHELNCVHLQWALTLSPGRNSARERGICCGIILQQRQNGACDS